MRKTKDDWIQKGLEILGTEGVAALTVERLTQALGVTKGSFYHHYESIPRFHAALLTAWEKDSKTIVAAIDKDTSPFTVLHAMLREFQRRDPGPEITVRAWAATDQTARETLERLDKLRTTFLSKLLSDALGDIKAGRRAALFLYSAVIGSLCIHPPLKLAALKQIFEDFLSHYNLLPPSQ